MKQICFLILTISLFAGKANAQNAAETFAFANKVFEEGNYSTAIKAYQRVLFFSKQQYYKTAYHNIADAYFQTSQYEIATKYYDLAYYSTENDSLKTELLFKKTTALIFQKKFNNALVELFNLDDSLTSSFEEKKNFYLGVSYYGVSKFDKAEAHFLLASSSDTEKNELQKLFLKNKKIDKLNPKTARTLSMILPGSGQIYAGDIKSGVNSLLLTGGLAVLFIYLLKTYSLLDAVLAVAPWYQRYFTGGFKNAYKIAQQKKQKKRALLFDDIMDTMNNN